MKYLDSPEFRDLLKRYEDALDSGDMGYFEIDDLIDLAEYYHLKMNNEKAKETMEYALEVYPDDPSALLFLARTELIDFHNPEKAKALYARVKDKEDSVEAIYVGAELMLYDGRLEEAEKKLQEAWKDIQRRSADGSADREYGSDYDEGYDSGYDDEGEELSDLNFPLDVAVMYTDNGMADQAEKWLLLAKPLNDDQKVDIKETWARIYTLQSRLPEAEKAWNELLDVNAYNVNAWLQLHDIQFHQEKYAEALQSVDFALAIEPNIPEANMTKGNCHYALGEYDKAEEAYVRYFTAFPDDLLARLVYGSCLLDHGKFLESYEEIKHVYENIDQLTGLDREEALRIINEIALKLRELGQ